MNSFLHYLSKTRPTARTTVIFGGLAIASSCNDRRPTEPVKVAPASAPSFSATPIGSYTVTMPPNNTTTVSGLPQYWIGMGGVTPTSAVGIPPGTAFRVKVSGFVTVSPNPQHQNDFPNSGATYESVGSYGPLGTGGAWNELKIYLDLRDGNGNVTPISVGPDTLAGAAVSGLYYSQGGGSLWVGHAGVWGATGNGTIYDGMYALDGSQLVTVEKITNVVSLSASPSRIRAGTSASVAFTATAADTSIHWGIGSWVWTPDVGAEWNPACQSYHNPCTVGGVSSSGTMTVNVWSGSAPFSAQARVTVYSSFTLDADKTTLVSGDSVTFTPRLDGVTSKVARWLWRGDDSSVVAAPCAPETGTCVQTPRRSGTMWAYTATTGGDSASKQVTVSAPTLTLTASKSTLAAPGENVTFSVSGSGPVTVLGWSFDTTASPTLIRMAPSAPSLSKLPSRSSNEAKLPRNLALPLSISSMLKPEGKVAVARGRSSRLAVPSSSSKLAGPGSSWGNCGASSSQCTNFVGTSGTVDVLASVNGDTVRASVQVNVVPCPTGDPLLDHPYIRKMLDSLWRLSWPDTNTTANRIERGGYLYYDSLTKKLGFVISPSSANNDACESYLGAPPPYAQVVRVIHIHPARAGKYVQCSPTKGHHYATQFGKPSGDDWAFAKEANDLNPGHGVIGWIIDQDEVITFDPEGLIIDRVPQPRGDTASVPKNWQTRTRNYYQRRQPGCTLP